MIISSHKWTICHFYAKPCLARFYSYGEQRDLKKKFLVSNVPRGGGTLDTHVGHVGPHSLGWEKNHKKKKNLLNK